MNCPNCDNFQDVALLASRELDQQNYHLKQALLWNEGLQERLKVFVDQALVSQSEEIERLGLVIREVQCSPKIVNPMIRWDLFEI